MNLNDGKARLAEYYDIDRLIAEAEQECLYCRDEDENIGGTSANKVVNTEELKMMKIMTDPKVLRLKRIKKEVPKALINFSGMEKEVLDLIYRTGKKPIRTAREVHEITKLPIHFVRAIDKQAKKSVCVILGY